MAPTRLVAAVLLLTFLSPARALAPTKANGAEKSTTAARRVLGNGLTLISEVEAATPTTAVQILVRGGKRAQPAGREGVAFLTTRLAVEIPDEDMVQDLVAMASRFQVSVRGDYSIIQIECLSDQLEPTLKILAKIAGDPLFSGLRIDSVKRSAGHQGRIEEDDSVGLGHLTALGAFSGTPGYGGSVYGSRESLQAIRGKDISEFYKKNFVAPNMVVAVSSDREDAAALVEKALGIFPAEPAPSPAQVAWRVPGKREISLTKGTKQAFVSEAFLLPKLSPRTFVMGLLLESILGKGPGSRLWPLRAEKKLAYNVNAAATLMTEGGLIEAYLETDREKAVEAREALNTVLSELWRSGVIGDELEAARVSVWGAFLRDNEVRPARTHNLAAFEARGFGLDLYYGLREALAAVSLEDLNAFLREIPDPERSVSVLIGPAPQKSPGQSSP